MEVYILNLLFGQCEIQMFGIVELMNIGKCRTYGSQPLSHRSRGTTNEFFTLQHARSEYLRFDKGKALLAHFRDLALGRLNSSEYLRVYKQLGRRGKHLNIQTPNICWSPRTPPSSFPDVKPEI